MSHIRGWIGVDFDGTLSIYTGWIDAAHVGGPVTPMVNRVKAWLAEGREVRVFTARIWPIAMWRSGIVSVVSGEHSHDRKLDAERAASAIDEFCRAQFGQVLPITCVKDFGMIDLWDDRVVQVRANTGEPV